MEEDSFGDGVGTISRTCFMSWPRAAHVSSALLGVSRLRRAQQAQHAVLVQQDHFRPSAVAAAADASSSTAALRLSHRHATEGGWENLMFSFFMHQYLCTKVQPWRQL